MQAAIEKVMHKAERAAVSLMYVPLRSRPHVRHPRVGA